MGPWLVQPYFLEDDGALLTNCSPRLNMDLQQRFSAQIWEEVVWLFNLYFSLHLTIWLQGFSLHLTPKKTHVGSMFQSLPFLVPGQRDLPHKAFLSWTIPGLRRTEVQVMATQTSLPLSPIGERLQVQFSTNASWRSEGWMVFVVFVFFFSLFLLTGFLVSPGMVRIGVGRFFLEGGLINAKDRIYQELQDFILVPLSR